MWSIVCLFLICFIVVGISLKSVFSARKNLIVLKEEFDKISISRQQYRDQTISDMITKQTLEKLLTEERKNSSEFETLFKKERGRIKSTEVRMGQLMEKLVPLLDVFGGDHENAVFLGMPIDFLLFNDDAVVFIEVKTGGAQLSTKQRKIRDLINDKKVEFRVVRIKPEEGEKNESTD